MKKYLRAFYFFLFPSCFFNLFRCSKGKIRIGFSFILVDEFFMGSEAGIGHFNFIFIHKLYLDEKSRIAAFNFLKGKFDIELGVKSSIKKFNKITSDKFPYKKRVLKVGYNTILGMNTVIDMTSNVTLGNHSIVAGLGTQIWTHGFYHSKTGEKRWRIDGEVIIGNNVYIGSRSVICAGVKIGNAITIGANSVISKDLYESGLYVNQALRYIEFDPDEAIQKYKKVSEYIYEKQN